MKQKSKKGYEKPEITKIDKMGFMFVYFEDPKHEITCRQCSSCHGCRGCGGG